MSGFPTGRDKNRKGSFRTVAGFFDNRGSRPNANILQSLLLEEADYIRPLKAGMKDARIIPVEHAVIKVQVGDAQTPVRKKRFAKLPHQIRRIFHMMERHAAHDDLIAASQNFPFSAIQKMSPDVRQISAHDLGIQDIEHGAGRVHAGNESHIGLQPQGDEARATPVIEDVHVLRQRHIIQDGRRDLIRQPDPPRFLVPGSGCPIEVSFFSFHETSLFD
jgi:hypothetical protein